MQRVPALASMCRHRRTAAPGAQGSLTQFADSGFWYVLPGLLVHCIHLAMDHTHVAIMTHCPGAEGSGTRGVACSRVPEHSSPTRHTLIAAQLASFITAEKLHSGLCSECTAMSLNDVSFM